METTIDVCIDLDDQKYKKKKMNPNCSLTEIRLSLKLSNDIVFISEGYPVDIADEEKVFLREILIEKGKSFSLNLKSSNNNAKLIKIGIYLNNNIIYSGKYPSSIILNDLLKDYCDLLPKDAVLMSEGYPVDMEDYREKKVEDILENNNLYYESLEGKSIENILENNKIEEQVEKIYIKIGKDTKPKKAKKIKLSEHLNILRENLKKELPFRFKFLDNGIPLDENEESKWTLEDIILTENESKILYIYNCEEGNIPQKETKAIKFCDISNNLLFKQKLSISQNLEEVRDIIYNEIKEDFIFMKKKIEINENDESDYLLKDIIIDDIVKLKLNNNNNTNKNDKIIFIKFKLNEKKLFADKINLKATLFEIRREFKLIPDNAKFLKDEFAVADERTAKVEDILKDNEYILLRDEENETKIEPSPVQVSNEMKKYKIYLNDKFLKFSNFKEKTTLDDIRKILSTSISDKEQFISSDNEEIPRDTEDQWTLRDYCQEDNTISIKTIKAPESDNTIKLNEPIKGAMRVGIENNLNIYKYPNYPFDDNEKVLCKTIMAVGETGSGKTTLLNSFLNFLMEIKYEDNFRYKIIFENMGNKAPGESVTDNVSIYYIRTNLQDLPYLRIVDTPGFGDTRGITYDKKIIDMIRQTFTDHCDSINAICFVAKSNETRLTDFQKYIFAQVMALFGKDVGENFMAMLTFSDGQVPNIVESLESKESIFSQIKDQIQDPWYLTFNNSAIFNGIEQKFTRSFWDLGMDSYCSFLRKLVMLPKKSLILSKQVLELRQKLEATITGLRPQIDKSLIIMENIRKEITYIKANKDKIDQFKDFKYKFKEPKVTKQDLKQGQYTSNCIICNYTCHYPCYIPDDNNKIRCSAMRDGFCTVCKNKCKWDQHKNLNFIYVYEEVEKTKTSEELRKKYVESSSNLKQSEQILKGLEQEFCDILAECYKNAEEIKKCVEKLKETSLCKNPNESFEEYIKNCILNEKNTKKKGYLERIKGYELLKDTNDRIIKAFKGQSIFEDLDKYKEYILQEKEKILKMYENEEKKDSNCFIF